MRSQSIADMMVLQNHHAEGGIGGQLEFFARHGARGEHTRKERVEQQNRRGDDDECSGKRSRKRNYEQPDEGADLSGIKLIGDIVIRGGRREVDAAPGRGFVREWYAIQLPVDLAVAAALT